MKKISFIFMCVLFSVVANAQSSHLSTTRLIKGVEVNPSQTVYSGDEMIAFPELGVELFWSQEAKTLYVMKRLYEKATVVYRYRKGETVERSVNIVSKVYEPIDLQGAGMEYAPETLGIRKNDGVYTLKAYGQPDGLIISVILEKKWGGSQKEILSREWKVK